MKKILCFLVSFLWATNALAAVGCDLNDPDRDVKRFFPNSTGYKTEYLSVEKVGGEDLYRQMESELGDTFSGIYEKIDVPYTVYTILEGTTPVGYIHGVNQKGRYGGMQVFLMMSPDAKIKNFYFQKLTSKNARELRSDDFGRQFVGLSLADFAGYDVAAKKAAENSKVAGIKNPAAESEDDFYAALRGTKKNLILMKHFIFERRAE